MASTTKFLDRYLDSKCIFVKKTTKPRGHTKHRKMPSLLMNPAAQKMAKKRAVRMAKKLRNAKSSISAQECATNAFKNEASLPQVDDSPIENKAGGSRDKMKQEHAYDLLYALPHPIKKPNKSELREKCMCLEFRDECPCYPSDSDSAHGDAEMTDTAENTDSTNELMNPIEFAAPTENPWRSPKRRMSGVDRMYRRIFGT